MKTRMIAALVPVLFAGAGAARAQEAPAPLDTIHVVAASRASAAMGSATRAVQVITAAQIRRMPAHTVPEVLRWALGADLMPRSPALSDLALRGSSFEQVLVLVDGVPVNDRQTGHFDLDLAVPLAQVERIEVVRGPASALFGADAVGGVVNVVTRAGGPSLVRAEGGSFGTAGLAAAHALTLGAARADLAGTWRRSDGHRPGTDYDMGQARAALTAPLGGRTLHAAAAYAARDFGADGFYGPYPSYERTRTTTASLAWRADPSARFALEPVLSFRGHHDDYILKRADPGYYRNRHTTGEFGGELTARYAVSPRLRLAAGGEGYVDRLRSSSLGDRSEGRTALLAEVAAGRVGSITGTAGLRLDHYESFGSFWSPSLGAAWWPVRALRLRASAGRSLRAPSWTERYYGDPANVGDPNLKPERAWSTEVGADAYPAGGVRIGLSAFQRDAHDLIDWARPLGDSVAPWHTRNVDDARFRGLEAELAVDDLLGVRWSAQASWLSVRASAEDGFTSKYALRPLVRQLSLAAGRTLLPGLDLDLRAERARRRSEEPYFADAYFRLDGRLSYSLGPARVYADVQNATDEAYPDITGASAPGRALFMGVEWRGR
ncbi:MAG TPA: TonB-dependent receptor [Longimicrobiaceae bacterium]|nr:TonB-dependent receptor [Longimicrobiaceae bacterium]